jgi:hypothetical protein
LIADVSIELNMTIDGSGTFVCDRLHADALPSSEDDVRIVRVRAVRKFGWRVDLTVLPESIFAFSTVESPSVVSMSGTCWLLEFPDTGIADHVIVGVDVRVDRRQTERRGSAALRCRA